MDRATVWVEVFCRGAGSRSDQAVPGELRRVSPSTGPAFVACSCERHRSNPLTSEDNTHGETNANQRNPARQCRGDDFQGGAQFGRVRNFGLDDLLLLSVVADRAHRFVLELSLEDAAKERREAEPGA